MKHAYYFSHDFNARNDTKTAAMQFTYHAQGYGWFWILVEMLAEDKDRRLPLTDGGLEGMAMQCHCRAKKLKNFIGDCIHKYGLFESDGAYFWSNSLNRRINSYEEMLQAKSRAGKKGAKARWEDEKGRAAGADGSAITQDGKGKKRKSNKTKENEIKGEESKGYRKGPGGSSKTSFDPHGFIQAYNDICKKLPHASSTTQQRVDKIEKFLLEFSLEDFRKVCQKANDSPFYSGRNDRGWVANFDYLIRPEKAAAVLEAPDAKSEEEGIDPAEKSFEQLNQKA